MPLLEQNRAIKEYYETVKHLYPGITFEQFSNICKTPGNYTKSCIQNGRLPIIMIKYLGKFKVFQNRLVKQVKVEYNSYKKGIITEEFYNQNRDFLTGYIRTLKTQYEEDDD